MTRLNRFFEPDGWQEDKFTSTTGKKIRYGHVEPAGEKKGTVIITTGYADFREAYHETIHEYLDRGYAVWMMDWAGHGGSEKNASPPKKGQTLDDHVEDLRKFRQEIVQFDKAQPVFLSTHSMGGQVALRYLEQHKTDFNFAILATPLVEMRPLGPGAGLMKQAFAAAVEGGLADQKIKDGRRSLTRQLTAERKDMREKNPVRMGLHKAFMLLNDKLKAEDPTIGYVDSLFKSTDKTGDEKFLRSISTPVLFGIGGADDVIDNESVRRAGRLVPNAKTVEIEGGLHALWIDRDTQRKAWWREIDGFIAEQLALKPVPPKLPPPQHKGP
ncbi:MAG TPA: alpha/beta hydrolase [Patescibacteria group bacterium]|nr:alpha/beta hydrolase [Patescibacteria group bacterium]